MDAQQGMSAEQQNGCQQIKPAGAANSTATCIAAVAAAAKPALAAGKLLSAPASQKHFAAFIALIIAAAVVHIPTRLPVPLDEGACQKLLHRFEKPAVLAGLQEQSAAAAAAVSGRPLQLHIITIAGRNTPPERVLASPLMRSLPPHLRPLVKVLKAETRLGHGLEGLGAYGAKIIEASVE